MFIQLTEQHDELLQNTDLNHVGTIVDDFENFFAFLQEDIPVSDKLKHMKGSHLDALNRALSIPLHIHLKRASQASYPHINGLYLLGLSSGLVKIQPKGKRWYLEQNLALYSKWDLLSDEQKYLNLLVTWLSSLPNIINEHTTPSYPSHFIHCCLKHLLTQEWVETKQTDFSHKEGLFNLALAELFGFLQFKLDLNQSKWQTQKLKLMPLGAALLSLLYNKVGQDEVEQQDCLKKIGSDLFEYALVPYFPHWTYLSPYPEPKIGGRYTFLLTIADHKAQATFSISHYTTLHQLVIFILETLVEFDVTCLYHIHYQDARYHNRTVYHPELHHEADECKHSDEVSLQDINFESGQVIDIIYGVDDNWTFHLLVTAFTEGGEDDPPYVIHTKGELPVQYAYHDDSKADDDTEDEQGCEFD